VSIEAHNCFTIVLASVYDMISELGELLRRGEGAK
jgi:hypothetical protein